MMCYLYLLYNLHSKFLFKFSFSFFFIFSGTFGWGTVLQAGMSQVQFPMGLLGFCIELILLAAQWPLGQLSL